MKTVKQWFEEVEDPRVMWFLLERMDCSKSGATVFWDDNQEKVTYTANEKSANSLRQAIEIGLIPKSDIEKQVIADAITAPDPIAYLRNHLDSLKLKGSQNQTTMQCLGLKTTKSWFEDINNPIVRDFLLDRLDNSKKTLVEYKIDDRDLVRMEQSYPFVRSLNEAISVGAIPWDEEEEGLLKRASLEMEPAFFIYNYLLSNAHKSDITAPQPYYGPKDSPHEVHKFISAHQLNFNRGCVVKYAVRAGRKDPKAEIKDLEKAIDYLKFEIERLKEIS